MEYADWLTETITRGEYVFKNKSGLACLKLWGGCVVTAVSDKALGHLILIQTSLILLAELFSPCSHQVFN